MAIEGSRLTARMLFARLWSRAPAALWRPMERWRSTKFWRGAKLREGALGNAHFEFAFTTLFGLERADFAGKTLLDIGCGPRGSLEWADEALERVGLDRAADDYYGMGVETHAMRYLCAPAEDIPVYDARFDVVSIFNLLDRVEDPGKVIREVERVTAPGGLILLLSVVNHGANGVGALGARHRFDATLAERFTGCSVERLTLSRLRADGDVYRSAFEAERVALDDRSRRAVLCARLRRNAAASTP